MISLREFKGRIPRLHKSLLPEGFAQIAQNCYLRRGALTPWKASLSNAVSGSGGTAARTRMFDVGGMFFQLFDPVTTSMARGAVDADRFYIADGVNLPRITNFSTLSQDLAVESPSTAPTIALSGGTVDKTVDQKVKFAYTRVTSLGEESKPSALSNGLQLSPGCSVNITGLAPYVSREVTKFRIYRTVTDYAGVAELYFVKEIASSLGSTTHTITDSDFQEVCPSKDYDTPRTTLRLLTALPNGMMVAADGNKRICFCEPYQPHAWPRKYELFSDSKIMGFAALGDMIVVLTDREPYYLAGSHPSLMRMQKAEEMLPCLSTRSIVDLGSAVVFASTDGLVMMSAAGPSLPTASLFTRDDWQALNPTSMFAVAYEGFYVVGHNAAPDGATMSLIDLRGDAPWYSTLSAGSVMLDLVVKKEGTGGLYGLPTGTSTAITQLDAGGPLSLLWRSGRYVLPQLVNIPWGRVLTDDTGSTTLRLYGGHTPTLIHAITTPDVPQRMPAGRLDHEFEVEIQGTATVYAASFAMDVNEL